MFLFLFSGTGKRRIEYSLVFNAYPFKIILSQRKSPPTKCLNPNQQDKKNVDLKTVKSKCPYDDNYTVNTFHPDTAAFLNNSEQTAHLRTESKETYHMYYLCLSFNLLHYQGVGLLFLAKLLSLASSCFLAYITSTFNCLEFRVLAIVCMVSPPSFVRIRNS